MKTHGLRKSFCMKSTQRSVWHKASSQRGSLLSASAPTHSCMKVLHQPIVLFYFLASAYYFKAPSQGLFLYHQGLFSGGKEGRSWGWFWFFQEHLNVKAWGFWKAGLQGAKGFVCVCVGGGFLFSFYPRDPVLSNACHTFVSKVSSILLSCQQK